MLDDFFGGPNLGERGLGVIKVATLQQHRDTGKEVTVVENEVGDGVPFAILNGDGIGDVVTHPWLYATFRTAASIYPIRFSQLDVFEQINGGQFFFNLRFFPRFNAEGDDDVSAVRVPYRCFDGAWIVQFKVLYYCLVFVGLGATK